MKDSSIQPHRHIHTGCVFFDGFLYYSKKDQSIKNRNIVQENNFEH